MNVCRTFLSSLETDISYDDMDGDGSPRPMPGRRSKSSTPARRSRTRSAPNTPARAPERRRSLADQFLVMQGALAGMKAQLSSFAKAKSPEHTSSKKKGGKKTPSSHRKRSHSISQSSRRRSHSRRRSPSPRRRSHTPRRKTLRPSYSTSGSSESGSCSCSSSSYSDSENDSPPPKKKRVTKGKSTCQPTSKGKGVQKKKYVVPDYQSDYSDSEEDYAMPPRMDSRQDSYGGQGTSNRSPSVDSDFAAAAVRQRAPQAPTQNSTDTPGNNTTFQNTLNELENFFELGAQVGQEINEAFARIMDCSVRQRLNDEHLKEIMKKYHRPSNVPILEVPRLNSEVWELLRKGSVIVDSLLQKIQALLSKAISIVLSIADKIGSDNGVNTEEHLMDLSNCLRFLGATFSLLNQVCKDIVRNDVGDLITQLCNWETAVGTSLLFDCDVGKKCEERDKATQWLKKKKKYRPGFQNYTSRRRRGRGGRRGGGRGGRGRRR